MAGLFASSSMAGETVKIELRQGISLQALAEVKLKEEKGTDSQVGKIIGPGFECRYDIGRFSDPLTSINGAELRDITLAGRVARLMQKGSDNDALHVMEVAESVLGQVNLTLHCISTSESARKAVRDMFMTLQIKS